MNFFKQAVFSIWYFFSPPWDTGISPPELIEFLDRHPPGRALDLGCGTGTNSITIARRGWQVLGIDFAPSAIRTGRKKVRAAGVEVDLRVGDVSRLDGMTGNYDLILDIGCLHGLSERGKNRTMENVARLLAPGGTYLLYCMLHEQDGESGIGMFPRDLRNLTDYFSIIRREDGLNRGTRPSAWLTCAGRGD